jgi:hypothetical protein
MEIRLNSENGISVVCGIHNKGIDLQVPFWFIGMVQINVWPPSLKVMTVVLYI